MEHILIQSVSLNGELDKRKVIRLESRISSDGANLSFHIVGRGVDLEIKSLVASNLLEMAKYYNGSR